MLRNCYPASLVIDGERFLTIEGFGGWRLDRHCWNGYVYSNSVKRSIAEIRKIIENVNFGDPMEAEVVRGVKRLNFRFVAE